MAENFDNLTPEDLARLVQAGQKDAFAAIVDRFTGRLLRYLRQRVGRDHDAEDIAQETFLRAYLAIDRFRPECGLTAWLFTIASRLAISHLRGRKTSEPIEATDLTDRRAEPPDELCARHERDGRIWSLARQRLSDNQFAALWLHYVEGLAVTQIAEALGKTRIHVKVLLHRARRRLLHAGLDEHLAQPAGSQRRFGQSPSAPASQIGR